MVLGEGVSLLVAHTATIAPHAAAGLAQVAHQARELANFFSWRLGTLSDSDGRREIEAALSRYRALAARAECENAPRALGRRQ